MFRAVSIGSVTDFTSTRVVITFKDDVGLVSSYVNVSERNQATRSSVDLAAEAVSVASVQSVAASRVLPDNVSVPEHCLFGLHENFAAYGVNVGVFTVALA